MRVRRIGIWIRRCLLVGATLWAITFLALLSYAAVPRDQFEVPDPGDAIVCLGGGMSDTQGLEYPDSASNRRAVTCAQLYNANLAPVIVFTGHGNEISSTAAAMARSALDRGVPEDAIILEEVAQSTIQNAAFSYPLLPQGTRRVIVVSDQFHLPRSTVIFRMFGAAEVATYPALPELGTPFDDDGRSDLGWIIREATAVWSNLARGGAYVLGGLAGYDAETRINWFN